MFRLLNHLRSDQQLIQEETELMAQVEKAEAHALATGKQTLPQHVYNAQSDKAQVLISRGYTRDNNGGWKQ